MDISEAAGTLDEVPRQFPNKVRIRTEVETAAKKPWHDVCLPVRKFYFLSYNEGHLRAYIVVVIDGLEIFFSSSSQTEHLYLLQQMALLGFLFFSTTIHVALSCFAPTSLISTVAHLLCIGYLYCWVLKLMPMPRNI